MCEDLAERVTAAGASQERFDVEMLAADEPSAERRLPAACKALEEMGDRGFLARRLGCLAEAVHVPHLEAAARLFEAEGAG